MVGIKVGMRPEIIEYLDGLSADEQEALYDKWFFENLKKHNPSTYRIFCSRNSMDCEWSERLFNHIVHGQGIGHAMMINPGHETLEFHDIFENWVCKKLRSGELK